MKYKYKAGTHLRIVRLPNPDEDFYDLLNGAFSIGDEFVVREFIDGPRSWNGEGHIPCYESEGPICAYIIPECMCELNPKYQSKLAELL